MLNFIWFGMIVSGFLVSTITGKVNDVTNALVSSSKDAITLSIGLTGILCVWTGLMNIAEKSGLVNKISKIIQPIIKFIFPEIPKNHPAIGAIIMNLAANFLGLGNAATPFGIKAMEELQKLNSNKKTCTNSMSMFLVLNTTAFSLIPATIIAVRSASGSKNPTEIISAIWITSICSTIVGILLIKSFRYRDILRGRK